MKLIFVRPEQLASILISPAHSHSRQKRGSTERCMQLVIPAAETSESQLMTPSTSPTCDLVAVAQVEVLERLELHHDAYTAYSLTAGKLERDIWRVI